jgi:hypothetical protein
MQSRWLLSRCSVQALSRANLTPCLWQRGKTWKETNSSNELVSIWSLISASYERKLRMTENKKLNTLDKPANPYCSFLPRVENQVSKTFTLVPSGKTGFQSSAFPGSRQITYPTVPPPASVATRIWYSGSWNVYVTRCRKVSYAPAGVGHGRATIGWSAFQKYGYECRKVGLDCWVDVDCHGD